MGETAWKETDTGRRRGPRRVSDLVDEPPRPRRYQRTNSDGLPHQPPLTMAEVEERIMRADDELAELTATHMDLAREAAIAEVEWKRHRDTVIVYTVKNEDRTAADYREALAREQIDPVTGKQGIELYERYKITEAAAQSSARAMRSIEARLNAFQTIAANLRKVSM
jgi:hypothetical protein